MFPLNLTCSVQVRLGVLETVATHRDAPALRFPVIANIATRTVDDAAGAKLAVVNDVPVREVTAAGEAASTLRVPPLERISIAATAYDPAYAVVDPTVVAPGVPVVVFVVMNDAYWHEFVVLL